MYSKSTLSRTTPPQRKVNILRKIYTTGEVLEPDTLRIFFACLSVLIVENIYFYTLHIHSAKGSYILAWSCLLSELGQVRIWDISVNVFVLQHIIVPLHIWYFATVSCGIDKKSVFGVHNGLHLLWQNIVYSYM